MTFNRNPGSEGNDKIDRKERTMMAREYDAESELKTDVVVIGYGGAGATAAIAAHDRGSQVIVLEKMPAGGGNTLASFDSILIPKGMDAVRYFETLCGGQTDHDVIEQFIKHALTIEDWLHELGTDTEPHNPPPDVIFPRLGLPSWTKAPGGDSIARIFIKWSEATERIPGTAARNPRSLFEFLAANVERRGITVMTDTPAKELVTEDGEIFGVIAEKAGRRLKITARRGVILACGGFEYNEDMKRTFLPGGPYYCFGPPGNTGDGIIMAQKVGAALLHMTSLFGPLALKAPEFESGFAIRMPGDRFIYVDRDGKRFTNETALKIHDMWRAVSLYDPERSMYPRVPTHCIFDEVTRKRAPLYLNTGANQKYAWSRDNSREIAKGWIIREESIRVLARRISIDETTLEDNVNKYNEFCRTGVDLEFGRSSEFLGAVETPPFYAVPLWPGLMSTHGGPSRDKEARVLDTEGSPIPRLYAAGELGALSSLQYEAGTDLCECLVFGRIAGQNAASEKPRH